MSNELKPCPFCGGDDFFIQDNLIVCQGCDVEYRLNEWNTRPTEQQAQGFDLHSEITGAHMAGQADAGVDPSWSNALAYFNRDSGHKAAQSQWVSCSERLPEGEEVVLIQVRSLGEHGLVSAWWHSDPCAEEYCWVALDDAVQYEYEQVTNWTPLPPLPGE